MSMFEVINSVIKLYKVTGEHTQPAFLCTNTRPKRTQPECHTCHLQMQELCYYLVSAKVSPAGQSTAQNKLGTVLSMNQCITAIRNCRYCPVLNKLETINSYRIKQLCTTRGGKRFCAKVASSLLHFWHIMWQTVYWPN